LRDIFIDLCCGNVKELVSSLFRLKCSFSDSGGARHDRDTSILCALFASADGAEAGIDTLLASYKLLPTGGIQRAVWEQSVKSFVSPLANQLFQAYVKALKGELTYSLWCGATKAFNSIKLNYYLAGEEFELIAHLYEKHLVIGRLTDDSFIQFHEYGTEQHSSVKQLRVILNVGVHWEYCRLLTPLQLKHALSSGQPQIGAPFLIDACPGKIFSPVVTRADGSCAIHSIAGSLDSSPVRWFTEAEIQEQKELEKKRAADRLAGKNVPALGPQKLSTGFAAKKDYADRLRGRCADLRADSESELLFHFARLIVASISSSSKGRGATLLYGAEANAMGRGLKKKYDDLLVTLKDQDKADYPDLSLCPLFRRMISETAWLDHYLQTVQNEKYCLEANEVPIIALLFNVHVTLWIATASNAVFADQVRQEYNTTGANHRAILLSTNHFWACRESVLAISSAPADSMDDEEGKGGEKEHDGKEDRSKRSKTKIRKANQQGGTTAKRAKQGSTTDASDATASAAGTAAAAAVSALARTSRQQKRKGTADPPSDKPTESTPKKKSRTGQSFASCFFDFWRAKHCTFSL
jgi:hypothetical protein